MVDSRAENSPGNSFDQAAFLSRLGGLIQDRRILLDEDQAFQLVSQRVGVLQRQSRPETIPNPLGLYQGFIHPESAVRISGATVGFKVDDPEIYRSLIWSVSRFLNKGSIPNSQIMMPHGLSLRQSIPYIVFDAVWRYFGSEYAPGNIDENRSRTYKEKAEEYMRSADFAGSLLPLTQVREKKIGMCMEHAAVAQNLAAVLGEESLLVSSLHCQIPAGVTTPHAYNLRLVDYQYYLSDTARPVTCIKGSNDRKHALYLFPLTTEQYLALMRGEGLRITRYDLEEYFDGGYKNIPEEIIYSAVDIKREIREIIERLRSLPQFTQEVEREWQESLNKQVGFGKTSL